ncbi:MAG: peptide-methionine (S)-S-oxide reductase MsrA [Bacteroidota bacterium]|jgi:peptide-methionine (S)-S-oxide reductase
MRMTFVYLFAATLFGVSCQMNAKQEITNFTEVNMNDTTEVATLAGGCFWCVEAIYANTKGVYKVESGYAGGFVKNPAYKEVCNGTTGHAEAVQITFDPRVVSFAKLLEIFFVVHDPTTLNRQGPDVGTQYRSAIFYHTNEQQKVAEAAIQIVNETAEWGAPAVTEITAFTNFYKAEDYHQQYFELHGEQPYCRIMITPKLEKFKKRFSEFVN